MNNPNNNPNELSPEASFNAIHSTLSQSQSALYLAGTATILLLWGALAAIGYLAEFAIANLAADFVADKPWFRAPVWGGIVIIGMVASSIIGSRASRQLADRATARRTGLKVFSFWMAVTTASWLIPGLSGLWTSEDPAQHIPGVAVGIVALGYILFGLFSRLAVSLLGIGFAASYYIPAYLAGEDAYPITAVLMLILIGAGALWLRKSGVA